MVCKILFALCIFTAGLRVQSLPTSTLLPVSLSSKITPPTSTWTSSPENTAAATASPTSDTHSNLLLPVPSSSQTPPLLKNTSVETRQEEVTRPASDWEGISTDPSPPGLSPTSGTVHLTSTPTEHSSGTSETSVLPTGSWSSAESPTLISSQSPVSSPSSASTSLPEVPSTPATTDYSSAVTSSKPPGTPTPAESPAEEHSSDHTPTLHATTGPVTTPQETVPTKVTCELIDSKTTATSPGVIMEEVEHALSSGSIAAITVTVIAVVLLVFGVAAYLKISSLGWSSKQLKSQPMREPLASGLQRQAVPLAPANMLTNARHSSYGRLLDDHDYGSWGNYNNPLYDDS